MALKIKNTPILKGKEVKEFSKKINSNKNNSISKESYKKIQDSIKNVVFKDNCF